MKRFLKIMFVISVILVLAARAEAVVLTFDNPVTPGLTLVQGMEWNGTGGGHLFCEQYLNDDHIDFSTPTYINDFQMNGLPYQGYANPNMTIGFIDIAAFTSGGGSPLWSTTADLRAYTSWSNWLTVPVETNNISRLTFYGPGFPPHENGFWPSIDNMRINEGGGGGVPPIPEPATLSLLGLGLLGLVGLRKKRV